MPSAPQSPLTGMTVCAQNGQEHSTAYLYDQSQLQFAQSKYFDHSYSKFLFLSKIPISVQNSIFCRKFRFSSKISTFGQNFHFCRKFRFLFTISFFIQNSDFFLILVFVENSDFCSKFPYFSKISFFV